jgi:hypothetical protein
MRLNDSYAVALSAFSNVFTGPMPGGLKVRTIHLAPQIGNNAR